MVSFNNTHGKVDISNDYFATLVGTAASSCFGVAGMSTTGAVDDVRTLVFGNDIPEKGVRVAEVGGMLVIELHIKVTYGLNIEAMVASIKNKVKYVVEDATELKVRRIDVYVDDIVSE